ncbi:hypothetical protein ACWEQP_34460 [Streptomyces sp. NPDC004044]
MTEQHHQLMRQLAGTGRVVACSYEWASPLRAVRDKFQEQIGVGEVVEGDVGARLAQLSR